MNIVSNEMFAEVLKPGELLSGVNPARKNATRLEILSIEHDGVHYRSLTSAKRRERVLTYSVLSHLVHNFRKLDSTSITNSVNRVLAKAGLPIDHTTETYAYAIANAYRSRAGVGHAETKTTDELPSTTQGFHSSPNTRRAVEDHAMLMAAEYFRSKDYKVAPRGKPFNLLCTRADGTLYVEVKGTQGSGAEILLTKGEVDFHREHSDSMALFVVSGIQVSADDIASGGIEHPQDRWVLKEDDLKPYAFRYRV